jgi:hypothetical protein
MLLKRSLLADLQKVFTHVRVFYLFVECEPELCRPREILEYTGLLLLSLLFSEIATYFCTV